MLEEASSLRPGFAPVSLLDAGSGPGTASWAAADIWPGLRHVTLLDSAPAFLKLAVGLAAHGPQPLARAEAVTGSIEALPEGLRADLVVAADARFLCLWLCYVSPALYLSICIYVIYKTFIRLPYTI